MRAAWIIVVSLLIALAATGCTSSGNADAKRITLYTCATASIEQAAIAAYHKTHPDVSSNVFRAPTGQLNARVAADVRSGGVKADVIWACDPLTMHGYDEQGLLRNWTPPRRGATRCRIPNRSLHRHRRAVLGGRSCTRAGHAACPWADLIKPAYRGEGGAPESRLRRFCTGTCWATSPRHAATAWRTTKR